jgi:medium-chain acyl-[acyl-carrier-protein] hydrolase
MTMYHWLAGHRPSPDASVRLLCFAGAGGSASSFWAWPAALPASIDVCGVQLPGRQARLHEPAITDLDALVHAIDTALEPIADVPVALFGHSFGALLAYELARRMRARGCAIEHLFVAALHPPDQAAPPPLLHILPDDDLVAMLMELNGTPAELLAHPELIELAIPAIRADLTLGETYRYRPDDGPLDVPISAFGGDADPRAQPSDMTGWARHTRGPFRFQAFSGDHFFIDTQRPAMLTAIVEALGR